MISNRDAVLNAHTTMIEMFEAREKQHIADELRKYGPTEFDEILKTKLIFVLDVPEHIRVLYCLEPKFKVPDLKRYIEDTDEEFESYIIVLREKPSANNLKSFQEIEKPLQIFELRELQFNISKHVLVPKHRLIKANDDRVQAIFQKLGIKSRSQLPVILRTDPMAKFLNAKTGDIIEVTRYSPTSGEHTFYRICV